MIFLSLMEDIDIFDAVLEGLSVLGYVFIFIMIFYAKEKNKIFNSKGFSLMVFAIICGLISSFMDFLSEFFVIKYYQLYKTIMLAFLISTLSLFALSLLLLFKFTTFLMGED